MGKLDGKVAIVTGGGTGIGKGIARAFATEGARVVIASRSEQTLNELVEELGDQVLAVPTDLKVEAQITALFERTIVEMGQLDILVNNSGVFEGGPIEELSLETWQHVMDVNLTGVFLCTREAMKIMKPECEHWQTTSMYRYIIGIRPLPPPLCSIWRQPMTI